MIIFIHSRIIVGTDMNDESIYVEAAHTFASLLQEGAIKEDIRYIVYGIYRSRSS